MNQNFSTNEKWLLTLGHLLPTYILTPICAYLWFHLKDKWPVDISSAQTVDYSQNLTINFLFLFGFFLLPVLGLKAYNELISRISVTFESQLKPAIKFNFIWRIIFIVYIFILCGAIIITKKSMGTFEIEKFKPLLIAAGLVGAVIAVIIKGSPLIALINLWSNKSFRYPLVK